MSIERKKFLVIIESVCVFLSFMISFTNCSLIYYGFILIVEVNTGMQN